MSLTTRVRFLAPLDPRLIWAKVRELLDAPAEYRYTIIRRGLRWPAAPFRQGVNVSADLIPERDIQTEGLYLSGEELDQGSGRLGVLAGS